MFDLGTKKYITLLKNFLGNKINSILEIQCGNAFDIESCIALQDKNLKYIGVDVVDEVIKDNRQFFRDEKNKLFMILDASSEPLPKCDLIICSGMMEYLPIVNIWPLIENIRDSGAKYVAFDYYHSQINNFLINEDIEINLKNKKYEENIKNKNQKENKDNSKKSKKNEKFEEKLESEIKEPIKRAINLTQAPFYFPLPQFLISTDDINHSIALYKIKDIELYMDYQDNDTSYLRAKLLPYLENDFNTFKNIFNQQENGEKLLKNALSINDFNWYNIYYNEPYKTIVDNNNIFIQWIDFFIFLYNYKDLNRLYNDQPERYKNLITEYNFALACNITQNFTKWKLNTYF